MNDSRKVRFDRLAMGVSLLAIGIACQPALAQDDVVAQNEDDAIVVTGIRASLEQAQNIKRNAQGVVDAISAEDIGKFPDTNLAESLQRITGVSIDRASGGRVDRHGPRFRPRVQPCRGERPPDADIDPR